ncbi:MAG: hypothetical protein ACPG42_09455 [Alphaproteobacteria bacterium]
MTEPPRRPSRLAPLLALIVAVSTIAWGVRMTSGWTLQQALFGMLNAENSADVRALTAIVAVAVLEGVLAGALLLGHWRPVNLHILGLVLVAAGVTLAQLALLGPFWALALLGAWLVWEAYSMRADDEG